MPDTSIDSYPTLLRREASSVTLVTEAGTVALRRADDRRWHSDDGATRLPPAA